MLPRLHEAITQLRALSHYEQVHDYWTACPENIVEVLELLARWAELHPDAVFYMTC